KHLRQHRTGEERVEQEGDERGGDGEEPNGGLGEIELFDLLLGGPARQEQDADDKNKAGQKQQGWNLGRVENRLLAKDSNLEWFGKNQARAGAQSVPFPFAVELNDEELIPRLYPVVRRHGERDRVGHARFQPHRRGQVGGRDGQMRYRLRGGVGQRDRHGGEILHNHKNRARALVLQAFERRLDGGGQNLGGLRGL